MRSEGSVLLQRAPGTQAEKARRLGVTQGTVSRWETGKSSPRSFDDRDACRRAYAIPLEAWGRAPSDAVAASVTA
ncbi:helix-turn-helix transcriptional regulator [Sorangium sp. So ce362]|uniref:helix-turn-helix transcriptional regulator n=1 Tax=Sorangium sp. So ce362 TaxID=3133303 RepID=UPI003F5E67FF